MTDLRQLRAALTDDERTPGGIDVTAIRTRARRARRRTVAAVSVAVLAVLAAGLVPISRLDSRPVPAAAAPSVTLRCPLAPDPRRDDLTMPTFTARMLLLCEYRTAYVLDGNGKQILTPIAVATVLRDSTTIAVVQRQLELNARGRQGRSCLQTHGRPVAVSFAAGDGRTASIVTQAAACGYYFDVSAQSPTGTPPAASCLADPVLQRPGPAPIIMPLPRDGLLLCRYQSFGGDADLVSATVLTGQPATALVREANALPAGAPSCPASLRVRRVALVPLGPDGGSPQAVADLGCSTIGNDTRAASLGGLASELDRLTGP